MQQGMAMFTSPVDHCLFLAQPRPSSSAGSHALPATNAALALLKARFSIRSGAGSGRVGVSVRGLCGGGSSGGLTGGEETEAGVPFLGLNYVLHPLFN